MGSLPDMTGTFIMLDLICAVAGWALIEGLMDILALSRGAGMSNVTRIRHALPAPADVVSAINNLDALVIKAIDEAKVARLPQGLKVAILHGHAHADTHRMVAR